jgi:hypothetical protein
MMKFKDKSINNFLDKLVFKKKGWVIVDHWEGDECAVGIANQTDHRKLVYVSTFAKKPGLFDFECEAPIGLDETEYAVSLEGKDVDLEELLKILENHLNLENL